MVLACFVPSETLRLRATGVRNSRYCRMDRRIATFPWSAVSHLPRAGARPQGKKLAPSTCRADNWFALQN
jgi:hypothetical protein